MKRELLALSLTTSLLFGCVGNFSYCGAEETGKSWKIKTTTELGFDSVYSIKEDIIIGQKDGKVAVWDSGKNQVVKTEYDGVEPSLSGEGITVSKKQKNKAERQFAVINPKTGDLLYELGEYKALSSGGIVTDYYKIIYASAKGKYGTIDKNGNSLIPIVHDEVTYIGFTSSNQGQEYTYHFKAGKDSSSGILYALYEDNGKCLTDYCYTEIYDNIHYIGRNKEKYQNIISRELIAEKPNGEIGFLINGKEVGFSRTVMDATDDEIIELVRIPCGNKEYFIQAVYPSKSLFDELAIEWGPVFNSRYNALISTTGYNSQNLKVLEMEKGIFFQCYDVEGNVVDKEVLIRQLKESIQATREEKEQEIKLKNSVKDVIRAADFSSIISQEDFDYQDFEITGQNFIEDDDNEIKIVIDKKHSRYYADFSVWFSYTYKEGTNNYDGRHRYDVIAILDNEKNILKYGVRMGSFSHKGYLFSEAGRCLLRDEQKNLYYYCYDTDKIIDKILLTKQQIPNVSTAGFVSDDFINVTYPNGGFVFDLEGNLIKEYRAFNYGYDSTRKKRVRMLIPSNDLSKAEYYDEDWRLINTVDISFLNKNIRSEVLELDWGGRGEYKGYGLLLSNDDVISVIDMDGGVYIASRDENECLSKSNYLSIQYAAGKYYIKSNDAIYSLSEHKLLFALEDSLHLDSDDDYMEIHGKTYWLCCQDEEEDGTIKSYYGLIDEKGEIVVNGINEKLVKKQLSWSEYSVISFENESGDRVYYYGTPLTAHSEEPGVTDISKWSSTEKIGGLVYKTSWGYPCDEIVVDEAGNILCESKKTEKRAIGFLTNVKYIVKVDSWWDGKSVDIEETPVASPTSTPDNLYIPYMPVIIPGSVPTVTSAPSASPSVLPTLAPDKEPTDMPSSTPEVTPSGEPVVTPASSIEPEPSAEPTDVPKADNKKKPAKSLKKGAMVSDSKTKAVYKVTGTGKNKTVEYVRSTKKNASKITVPAKVKLRGQNYKVTSIAKNALKNNKKLSYVIIGKNVKKIGKKAFYGCKKLRYIYVKSKKLTAKNIGKQAFGNGYPSPRVKSAKSVWRRYARILPAKGLSKRAVYIINPVKLVL